MHVAYFDIFAAVALTTPKASCHLQLETVFSAVEPFIQYDSLILGLCSEDVDYYGAGAICGADGLVGT